MAKVQLLQDIQIKKAKPQEKDYFLNDGGGLRILIKSNGNKIWEYRYTINDKRKKTTFKTYPIVSLIEARTKRQEYQTLINRGIDPIKYFKTIKDENIVDNQGMFLNVVDEWLKIEAERTKENTHQNKIRIFENDINPFLKNKHIKDVKKDDILKIIQTKEIQAPNVASKIFVIFKSLFNYAVFKGYVTKNIFENTKEERKNYIKPQKVKHFSKITDEEILKELVNDIYNYTGMHSIRNALKFVLHIPLRADNLCNLKWSYIDFDKNVLTIPRELMKVKNINLPDFRMPLTNEVINILKEQQIFSGYQEWIFLGNNNRDPINSESPNGALKRMGYNNDRKGRKQRLHSFRGTFRSLIDTLDIDNKFSYEIKEKALDHHEESKTVRAYANQVDYINRFLPLMNSWSDFVLSLRDND
ncbi:tyrosine-type recombinase/integrase [Aliarcobacter butzleri]|uniref:tyrosine-type recombinase/integrase n=1 Tax=Aliarcobacter butzleri TaxID=28197 RepID=UPI001EDAF44D|nr:integrase arm-type DNA-binding domain-containing protein [Aliarcobacter butzleri]MCG3710928.1 tyrosine-type recombinase/integrase [Aliarcobacter butzleri]MCG3714279.1 tyrosine-type recombinase/integrase [Aliarcobacter butzleri]MCT7566723.1 tyrosine-type recombinase/integrase [Aliarcobacter butzleri]